MTQAGEFRRGGLFGIRNGLRLAAVLLATVGPGVSGAVAMEPDVNRPGGSYFTFVPAMADPEPCRIRCEEEDNCRAWTYVRPGAHGAAPRCWLKNTVPAAKADPCCISGVKLAAPPSSPAAAHPQTPLPQTQSPRTPLVPSGPPREIAIDNPGAVRSGPRKPAVFEIRSPMLAIALITYHWNNGAGAPPGTLRLVRSDGRVHGPWQAQGLAGQGGVANAYWRVDMQEALEPGRYRVVDSDPATWSTNAAADHRGFFKLTVRPLVERP